MLQAKRQQQTLAGAEDHRTKISRAVNDAANAVDAHSENWPNQRNNQTKQTHNDQGHDRDKAGAAEESQGIRQADIVEALVQHPDNDPGDHRPEDPGVDGLNTNHALNVVGLQNGGVGGRQYAFCGQPEVNRRFITA